MTLFSLEKFVHLKNLRSTTLSQSSRRIPTREMTAWMFRRRLSGSCVCLKARYRAAFLAKFASIFIRPGPDVTVGGSCGSCWIVTGYKAKKDKGGPRASYQVYLSGRDLRVTICAAVAAVVYRLITQAQAMNMDDDIKWPYNEGDEASHVCHLSNCINPDHITVEPKNVNQGLSNCCGAIYCPNCDVSLDSCRHEPPCVWSSWATYCSACGYAENTAHNNHQGM